MSFYENTLVTKQDLGKTELEKIKEKYDEIINNNSGKVIKIEECGLLNLARKIKRYKKGFYIHYKFEGSKETLNEILRPCICKLLYSYEPYERPKPNSNAGLIPCLS